jgi:hypothetical protein
MPHEFYFIDEHGDSPYLKVLKKAETFSFTNAITRQTARKTSCDESMPRRESSGSTSKFDMLSSPNKSGPGHPQTVNKL